MASLLGIGALAHAGNYPFTASVMTTDSSGPTLDQFIGASEFLELADYLIYAESGLSEFENRNYVGDITYLGIENAIAFYRFNDSSPNGYKATINMSLIDVNLDFEAASEGALDDKIEKFFENEGADLYARFLAKVSQQSPASVTDGNPNSATASQADVATQEYGWTDTGEMEFSDNSVSSGEGSSEGEVDLSGFGIGFNSGTFTAGNLSGTNTQIVIPLKIGISERLKFVGSIPFQYLTLEDAEVFGAGINFALSYRIKVMTKENPWNWKVTPFVGINARVSVDLAAGTGLYQYGLVNTFDYRIAENWIISMVNQVSAFEGFGLSYEDYRFDSEVSQVVVRNGLKATRRLTKRLFLDGFVMDTRFTEAAAVDQYITVGTSLAFRLTRKANLRLGFSYDKGDDFEAQSFGLSSVWNF